MRLLRWVGGIVVFFWALGFAFRIGGSMIHLLLAMAEIIQLYNNKNYIYSANYNN